MKAEDDSILAADLQSVSSCTSLVRDDDDEVPDITSCEDIYLNTHAGQSLQKVLGEMLETNDITIQQFIALKRSFNNIYHDGFSQCQSKLHVSLSGTLQEFTSLPSGSVFHIEECTLNGPSSSIKIPRGNISLAHAGNQFSPS